ncbi:MAG: hypothetical protein H8E46_00065, partial [FCB group bacterium]|nr:hypothetical protein [FCB group bacterium]
MPLRMASSFSYIKVLFIALSVLLLALVFDGCARKNIKWSAEVGPPDGGSYRGVAAGDFNGDSHIDLAAGSIRPGGVV